MRRTPRPAILLVLLAASALGWYSPIIWNVSHSAAMPGRTIVVNADVLDSTAPPFLVDTVRLFYSNDDQATWQQTMMAPVSLPGYDSTWAGSFVGPSSGTACFYIRAGNLESYGTESPLNSGDDWPVPDNLLAELAYETTGDTINDPDGEWLDLTSAAMGYSDGKLYCRLTNHHNSWPTRGSIIGPWYLYSVGFRNPDSPGDTWGYAMTHVSILTYSDGLYEVNGKTNEFTRIGDIDIRMDGNRLTMRCDIADLAARPRFQPWPNVCGYLCTSRGDARSANLSLESWLHDSTNSGRFYVATPRMLVGRNTLPVLTNPRVLPQSGPVGTEFSFSVRYSDADSNLPVLHAVVVDAETLALTPAHHQYVNPDVFDRRQSGFAEGDHEFRFVFSDGDSFVTTPTDTFTVIDTTSAVAESPFAVPRTLSAEPNPFSGTTVVTLGPRASGSTPRTLTVCDASGRIVYSEFGLRASSFRLDLRSMPAGVYYLKEHGSPLRRLLVKLDR